MAAAIRCSLITVKHLNIAYTDRYEFKDLIMLGTRTQYIV